MKIRGHDDTTIAKALGTGIGGFGKIIEAQAYWKGVASRIIWPLLLIRKTDDF